MPLSINLPEGLNEVFRRLPSSYLVGGSVRDALLGLDPKDFDVEVYGYREEDLLGQLEPLGQIDLVGRSFGVIKLTVGRGETYDISMARRDSLGSGSGHRNFSVDTGSDITIVEGCARRDLTINSMLYDPRTGEIVDPYGGMEDLRKGILKHTSDQFVEDPLRVLRVMQFAGRFNFDVAPETVHLAKSMIAQFDTLPAERVGEEWFKALTKGQRPSKSLDFLEKSGWLGHFPGLQKLVGCPQDPEWHPEGDVWEHTKHCMDALATMPSWQALPSEDRYTTMLGILCHDLGKPETTRKEFNKGLGRKAWVSPGHDQVGEVPTRQLLAQFNTPKDIAEQVVSLVVNHMSHLQVKNDTQIRRLSVRTAPTSLKLLGLITEADHSGRPPLPQQQPEAMERILERAEVLGCLDGPPEPIFGGRHIREWSALEPGKGYGVLCRAAYEAQLDGHVHDEISAKEWFIKSRGTVLGNAGLGPERLLSGNDLLSLYETKPGKLLGALHRDLYDRQLDGELRTREDAWEYVKTNYEQYGIPRDRLDQIPAFAPNELEM